MKANLVKILQAMGLQRVLLPEHKMRSLSRSKNVDNSIDSDSASMKTALSVVLDVDSSNEPEPSEAAYLSWLMRAAVRGVAKYFPTAIISGRSREKVKEFVQLPNVYYAGSHGMDIMAPPNPVKNSDGKSPPVSLDKKGNEVLFQPAKKFLPAIRQIYAELEEKTRRIPGARLEDNRFCISVHFRQVKEEDVNILREMVRSVIAKYPDFHLTGGKKVIEIRPSIEWNKGNALEYLLETLGFKDSSDVLPLYIGDDRTDEDAFKAIERRGQGYPIIVSTVPKDTKALYSLSDPSEVLTFLSRLARWRRASSCSSRSSAQIWGLGD
ncbi:hypothetical protein CRG98_027550 [Punica granatum]|uniref:Trehalose 6-phosphate phosphatase n=1 Tax=Punica granatum TaxID=22663 RepID=A0A2I0J7C3_PUNGR|nr:hypothetical protein CRG98_027550 [Punica granatum]